MLVLAPQFHPNYTEMIQQLCPSWAPPQVSSTRTGSRTCVWESGLAGQMASAVPGMWCERDAGALREIAPEALAARQADQEFDDPINIHTSGTTGNPKGATLPP
jgi:long-subunit acyl-CoA synthetase (AMP-forming)